MPRRSAGLLMYRWRDRMLEVLLVHLGGPYWVRRDLGGWVIPKGEYGEEEEAFAAAKREFEEETGIVPMGEFKELTEIKQSGGKWVKVWAFEGDCDPTQIRSNTFVMEWPPKSGQFREFPEVDRAEWFSMEMAKQKILSSQIPLLVELEQLLEEYS